MPGLVRTVQRAMGKAIRDFHMIEAGDRVLVCVSGGADSLALLRLLQEYREHQRTDFSLVAGYVDLGFSPDAAGRVEAFLRKARAPYRIIHTTIAEMAFDPNASKNPCFICSHHRRHEIYKLAHAETCSKIAFGHHKDDIVETLLLNILYSRKIEAMCMRQEVFQGSMHVVRPLGYLEESLVKRYARNVGIEAVPKMCRMDGNSRRDKVRRIIRELQAEEKNANIRSNIFRALYNVNVEFEFKEVDS